MTTLDVFNMFTRGFAAETGATLQPSLSRCRKETISAPKPDGSLATRDDKMLYIGRANARLPRLAIRSPSKALSPKRGAYSSTERSIYLAPLKAFSA